jgi:hypothetical protein
MTEIHCAALLFDMDGVLINSTPAVARVWRRWAIEHGFNPEEVVARAHGRPSLTTVREYLPNADHEAATRCARSAGQPSRRPLDHRHVLYPAARRGSHQSCRPAAAEKADHLQRHHSRQAASRALPERRVRSGVPRGRMHCPRRRPRRGTLGQGRRCESHRLQNHGSGTCLARSRRRLGPEQLRRYSPARSSQRSDPRPPVEWVTAGREIRAF